MVSAATIKVARGMCSRAKEVHVMAYVREQMYRMHFSHSTARLLHW